MGGCPACRTLMALTSGAITLSRPKGAVDPSKRVGEADAVYLLTLLHHLTKPSGA